MTDPVVPTKRAWQSKTYWSNAIVAAVLPLLPPDAQAYLNVHPMILPYLLIGMNVVLRQLSHGKIILVD